MQDMPPNMNYSVKVINPDNKGGFIVEEWMDKKYEKRDLFEEKMADKFSNYTADTNFQCMPWTCKQIVLASDDDLKEMYLKYEGKKSIKVWLKLNSKRSSTGGDPPQAKRSRTESHLEKMDELQEIVAKLKEKHKSGKYSKFSKAQFHCWGNTIQLGHHDSYEDPPNKPFFGCPKTSTLTAVSPVFV